MAQSTSSSLKSSKTSQLVPQPYQVVSLTQWFHGTSSLSSSPSQGEEERKTQTKNKIVVNTRKRILPLIDLRSYESFTKCHLANPPSFLKNNSKKLKQDHQEDKESHTDKSDSDDESDSNDGIIVHLPFRSLESGERSCELPPRNVPFAILVPEQQNQEQQQASETKYIDNSNHHATQIHNFFFATKSKVTSQSRKPWLVKQIIYENNEMWNNARELGILNENKNGQMSEESSVNKNNCNKRDHKEQTEKKNICVHSQSHSKSYYCNHNTKPSPLPRLWKPDKMVKSTLLPLLKQKLESKLIHCQNKNESL